MRRIHNCWHSVAVILGCCCLFSFETSVCGQRASRRQPPAAGQPAPAATGQPAAANQPAPAAAPAAALEPLRTPTDRPVNIRDIRLDLRVDLQKKTVDSKATVQFQTIRPTHTVSLDAAGFEVKQVTLASVAQSPSPARYTYDGTKMVIDLGSRWPAGRAGTFRIDYRLQSPKEGLHFFAPTKASPEAPLMMWSQGEPIQNRYWIPCIDEPDQRQTTEVVATVPEGCEAVSNGKLIKRTENKSDKTVTFDWRQDLPHPSYLVTLVVGEFDVIREQWEGIPVTYYVPKGHQSEVAPTYGKTRDMLTYFSQRFGIHYPWAKYAQVNAFQFGGGMENTSATTMGDRILLDQRSLLDRSAESIVSHELAHQWWGDMLTCRDWSHLWLNEGFASYAEALWDEHSQGADAYAYNMFTKAGGAINGGRTRPVMDRRYTSPDAMFDNRSYPKGAWVLHMLRQWLGDDIFWQGIKRYGSEHKFQSVETADFRRSMEHASGRDLERFFYDWLERPGNPSLDVATEFVPDTQEARIVVKQTQAGEPFHFPLKISLHCSGTSEPKVIDEEMTEKELSLRVTLPGALQRVDVDPDQAVLASIKETKSIELWRAQSLEAPSVPARIRAARHFAESKTDDNRAFLARAFAAEKYWPVKVELARALGTVGGTVCRDALLEGRGHAEARVRRACLENLGKFPRDDKVAAILKEILQKGDPSYAVESAALTSYAKQGGKDALTIITPWLSKPSHDFVLTGAALDAIASVQDPASVATLLQWAEPGKPRNCRMAAQRGLAQVAKNKSLTDAQRQSILKNFMAVLESDDRFLRFNVLAAIPDLGPVAAPTLPILDKIIREETEGRLKEMVKAAADKIRGQTTTASAPTTADVSQLREEVKRLTRDQEELRKRLDKYEKAVRLKN